MDVDVDVDLDLVVNLVAVVVAPVDDCGLGGVYGHDSDYDSV